MVNSNKVFEKLDKTSIIRKKDTSRKISEIMAVLQVRLKATRHLIGTKFIST